MAGYPKIWTFIRHEVWWKQLKASGRGAFIEMILMIKEQHDNGHLVVSSISNLAAELSINRKVMSQLITKMTTVGTIEVVKNDQQHLHLYFPKYMKWQEMSVAEAVKSAQQDGIKMTNYQTNQPDQPYMLSPSELNLQDDKKPKKKKPPQKPSGDHQIAMTFFCDEYKKYLHQDYLVSGGKDGKAMKTLLNHYGLDKLKRITTIFFITTDPWFEQTGRSITIMAQHANKLAVELSNVQL